MRVSKSQLENAQRTVKQFNRALEPIMEEVKQLKPITIRDVLPPAEFFERIEAMIPSQEEIEARIAAFENDPKMVEFREIYLRYREAYQNPSDQKSKVWVEVIGTIDPGLAALFWRHLPDPLAKRGRPQGSAKGELAEQVVSMSRAGETYSNAARRVLVSSGNACPTKGQVDALVRLAKQYER